MTERVVPFAQPDMTQREADAAAEAVLSGWLTTSDRCARFEGAFAERVGAAHAVALNSCTAALHLALEGLGVQPGSIVVTTPYGFASSAEVIRYLDAVPVFVDVEPDTCNIDVDKVEEAVDRLARGDEAVLPPALRGRVEPAKPAAVLPVHIAGVPCDLDRIYKLAAAFDLAVVEDAAHAFPSSVGERAVGAPTDPSVPAAVCFSFYATKTITTGEGGMLTTHDGALAERVRRMSLHGLSKDAWTRYSAGGSWRYDITAPGFKYNLTDMAAAIGLVQLERADEMTARRVEIARRYTEAFADVPGLGTPEVPDGVDSAWHLYMLRVDVDRDECIAGVSARGVGTSVHFIPLHLHSYYRTTLGYEPEDFPVALRAFEREVSLPIYSRMTDEDVEHVCRAVVDVVTQLGG